MTQPLWLKQLLSLLSALWLALKELRPYAVGAAFQALVTENRRLRMERDIERANSDEARRNFEEFERWRNASSDDNADWLRQRAAQSRQRPL